MAQPNPGEAEGRAVPCTYARSCRGDLLWRLGRRELSKAVGWEAALAGQPSPLRFSRRKPLCQPSCPRRGEQGAGEMGHRLRLATVRVTGRQPSLRRAGSFSHVQRGV